MPGVEEAVVAVAAVHDDDTAFRGGEGAGNGHFMPFAVGDEGEGRQVPVMIEHQVELDGSLRLPELRPGGEGEALVDGGGVQAVERIFEAEVLHFPWPNRLALGEEFAKEPLVELRGLVGIGVGQRAFARRRFDAEMIELAVGQS